MNQGLLLVKRGFEVGRQLLALSKSVVRFVGPYRQCHPEWSRVKSEARTLLSPEDAKLAAKMDKALVQLRRAEAQLQVRRERDDLSHGRIAVSPLGPLLKELLRLHHVELKQRGDGFLLVTHASQQEIDLVADRMVGAAENAHRKAHREAVQTQGAVVLPIAAAENRLVQDWLDAQLQPLRTLQSELRQFVDAHRLDLAGLVDLGGLQPGNWKAASVSAVAVEIVEDLLKALTNKAYMGDRVAKLTKLDWEDLELALEREFGLLARTCSKSAGQPTSTLSIDYVFQRVLVDADGERLGFAQIFERAKTREGMASLFPMACINSDHRNRIRGLVGSHTRDGWRILGNDSVRGRRREFWAER
jgi:hypothetical protein